jgi:hypothetical protein
MIFTKKWLEKNRQKSEEEKKVVALATSLGITAFIVLIWVLTLVGTIQAPEISMPSIDIDSNDISENTANVVESVSDFFKGEETYIID